MSLHLGGFSFFKKCMRYLKIYSRKEKYSGAEREKGYKIRILDYPLSRLTREQELWARYTTHVVTESDLWMSALRSRSCSSFKVFLQCCIIRAGGGFSWRGLMAKWAAWIFISPDWWQIAYGGGASRCCQFLPLLLLREAGVCSCKVDRRVSCFSCFCVPE